MDFRTRTATTDDLFYLTDALHKTFGALSECDADHPYYAGFSNISIDDLERFALEHLDARLATTIVLLYDGQAVGCIMGKIAPSQVPASGVGLVGWIGLCHVDEAYRKRGGCTELYTELETWFRSKSIRQIELSYMAANAAARPTWGQLGFSPLRVISGKQI